TKIALSALSAVAATLLIGAGTYAYFSDIATSSSNAFSSGVLNLQLDDISEGISENVSASFGAGTLSPGNSVNGFVSLHNGGTVDIAEVKMAANQTSNANGGDGSDIASVLDLTVLSGDDNTCTTSQFDHTISIAGSVGDDVLPVTLAELNAEDFDSLSIPLTAGSTKYLCVTFTMKTGAGDEYQGDSILEDFVFTAHQHASQI
ncbi:hypothetical protein A2701_03005, partial [Candidatus Amesbacteria bacterium RIFCSPHIGHO2_01_FULL_47_34]